MDEKKLKLCKLCLKVLEDNFEIVEYITMEMMDVILIEVNLLLTKDTIICTTCFKTVKKLFFFKSMCLEVEESINEYIRTKNKLLVNLQEVYLNRRALENEICMFHKKVCRFCLKLHAASAVNEIEQDGHLSDILKKYYPELDLNTTDGIFACGNCLDCLIHHFNFATNLLDTEKNISTFCSIVMNNNNALIDLESVSAFSSESIRNISELTTNVSDEAGNPEEMKKGIHPTRTNERSKCVSPQNEDFDIKLEELDIKAEMDDNFSTTPEERSSPERPSTSQKPALQKPMYHCDYCPYKTKKKNTMNKHSRKHRYLTESDLYKCDLCPFESCYKYSVRRHILTHRNLSDVVTFKCDQCNYRGKYKWVLETHIRLYHGDESELELHRCTQCPYEARLKGNLKKHLLVHKTSSEVAMHKCNRCPFQTKHKISLKTHMLRHKSPSEVTLHKCPVCGFTALHKGNLKLHLLTHEDETDAVMYECDKCGFKTKHKMSLKTHLLQHRRPSEMQMQKCAVCNFKTSHKGNLKKHEVIHKNPSEVKMYSCGICEFKTRHRESLNVHKGIHSS